MPRAKQTTATLAQAAKVVSDIRSRAMTAQQRRERAAEKAASPKGVAAKKRKYPRYTSEPTVILPQMSVNPTLLEVIDIARLQRKVSRKQLILDILTGWATKVVDLKQAIYRETLPSNAKLPALQERWPGYLASIGFGSDIDQDIPPDGAVAPMLPEQPALDVPPPVNVMPPDEPLPAAEPVAAALPAEKPTAESIVLGVNEMYRPPEYVPIGADERDFLETYGGSGVKRFDPDAHAAAGGSRAGMGNSAQGRGWGGQPPVKA